MKFFKCLAVLAVMLLALPVMVRSQAPIDSGVSATTTVTNLETLVVSASAIRVDPDRYPVLIAQVAFRLTTTSFTLGVSNVVFKFQTSIDNGTTYSTDYPITLTATANTNVLVIKQGILSLPTTTASSVQVITTSATNSTATVTTAATVPSIYPAITHIKLGAIQNYNGLNVTNIDVNYKQAKL